MRHLPLVIIEPFNFYCYRDINTSNILYKLLTFYLSPFSLEPSGWHVLDKVVVACPLARLTFLEGPNLLPETIIIRTTGKNKGGDEMQALFCNLHIKPLTLQEEQEKSSRKNGRTE